MALSPIAIKRAPLPHVLGVEAASVVDSAVLTVESVAKLAGRTVLAILALDVPSWPQGPSHAHMAFPRVGVALAGVEQPERRRGRTDWDPNPFENVTIEVSQAGSD